MSIPVIEILRRSFARVGLCSVGCMGVVVLTLLSVIAGGAAADRLVIIGAMYNLTGGQRDLDIPSSQGARLAVDEANGAGGVLNRPVKLILRDGQTRPEVIARETATLFRNEPTVAGLIGFSDTDMVLAAAPIAAKHKRVFLASGATSPKLPQQVPEYLFLACFGDNVQAAAGAEWAFDALKARSAVRGCCTGISKRGSSNWAGRCSPSGPMHRTQSRHR